MKYFDPVYDRTLLDVRQRTSKGFFNASDWNRIVNNTRLLNSLVNVILSESVAFSDFPEANTETVLLSVDINNEVDNVNALWSAIGSVAGVVPMRSNYGGIKSPNYKDINTLEKNIDTLTTNIIDGYSGWDTSTGTGRFPRADNAICGTGMTRQNGFRRYA